MVLQRSAAHEGAAARVSTSCAEEGATQVFRPLKNNDLILGAVGILAVRRGRPSACKSEYGVEATVEPVSVRTARWIACEDDRLLERFKDQGLRASRPRWGRTARLSGPHPGQSQPRPWNAGRRSAFWPRGSCDDPSRRSRRTPTPRPCARDPARGPATARRPRAGLCGGREGAEGLSLGTSSGHGSRREDLDPPVRRAVGHDRHSGGRTAAPTPEARAFALLRTSRFHRARSAHAAAGLYRAAWLLR
ncbi:MAG: hypothetical protein MZV65_34900 [Chromatiales bacterium]|nr:hypothetical protein [Chromatiales bacterium]